MRLFLYLYARCVQVSYTAIGGIVFLSDISVFIEQVFTDYV